MALPYGFAAEKIYLYLRFKSGRYGGVASDQAAADGQVAKAWCATALSNSRGNPALACTEMPCTTAMR
jgi:hypothetical protein